MIIIAVEAAVLKSQLFNTAGDNREEKWASGEHVRCHKQLDAGCDDAESGRAGARQVAEHGRFGHAAKG